jgi:predicted amidohydrolase YtcJ
MGTIWTNGTIYTMKKEGDVVESLYTENGIIKEIGALHTIKNKYQNDSTNEVDLNGASMLPGFIDSHMHLIGHGEKLQRLDLSHCTSKEETLEAVRQKLKQTELGQWVIGEGWNENLWADMDIMTRDELDILSDQHPILLKRICRHAIVVNSLALDWSGITELTQSPEGGEMERNGSGNLNGMLKDKAQDLVLGVLPTVSGEYLERALNQAIEDAWKKGIVGSHTEDLSYYGQLETVIDAFHCVIGKDKKPFRAHLLVHHLIFDQWKEFGHSFLSGDEFIDYGAMKIFADGALGGRTALLSAPYADNQTTNGMAIHHQNELNNLVEKARKAGSPVAVHAIGDLAAEMVLRAIEKHPSVDGKRDRLIHAQLIQNSLLPSLKKEELVLDIQPRFIASDFPWVLDRVKPDQVGCYYGFKTLLDKGIHCSGGSDAPIEEIDPLLGIHAAVTRKIPKDPTQEVFMEEERLTMYEAISLFTKGSAYASHHEHNQGMIEEGYYADFTILKEDPFTNKAEDILHNRVDMTVVAEKIVYNQNNYS